nr:MAG TPA: hypothetical protein [Caudoviricetes sp.]
MLRNLFFVWSRYAYRDIFFFEFLIFFKKPYGFNLVRFVRFTYDII